MEILITGVDLFTAVGATADVTYFSVRAGLSRFTETGAVNRQKAARIAAVLPGFRHSRDEARLAELAAGSAARAMERAQIDVHARLGLTLCVPGAPRPDPPVSVPLWTSALRRHIAPAQVVGPVRVVHEGAAGIASALLDACSRLERGEEEAMLIGGADSWLPLYALRWLEQCKRLKIGGRVDGLIPGEAAGFVVLEPAGRRAGRDRALAVLRASSLAYEPGHYESDAPCLSQGYTQAIREVMTAGRAGAGVGVIVSDLNGESYKAKEWAVAEVRTLDPAPGVHLHPSDCYGDVGSMAGVTQLAIAAIGLSRGELTAQAMVVAGSDGPGRAVVLLEAPRGGSTEPNMEARFRPAQGRADASKLSAALIDDHLEEAGFLRLQRRLAEARTAERWDSRYGHDRRHAWHLLALAAHVPEYESHLLGAVEDTERAVEDRAAALSALAFAGSAVAADGFGHLSDASEALVLAASEALQDLPQPHRDRMRSRLGAEGAHRTRVVLEGLGATSAADEQKLLAYVERGPDPVIRQRAVCELVERRSQGFRVMLRSSRLEGIAPIETVAWALASFADRDAVHLAQSVPGTEMTPRLLLALGAGGYTESMEVLLQYVADAERERADAAASALAALSGVEVLEPAGEDEAADETWCRSADRWIAALETSRSQWRGARALRGQPWSSDLAGKVFRDPATRNGVRSVAGLAMGREVPPTTAYYWLQLRASS